MVKKKLVIIQFNFTIGGQGMILCTSSRGVFKRTNKTCLSNFFKRLSFGSAAGGIFMEKARITIKDKLALAIYIDSIAGETPAQHALVSPGPTDI